MPEPLGYVDFDDMGIADEEVLVRVPATEMEKVRRGQYVKIESKSPDKKKYLGRIISGPLFVPDAVDKNSAFARASILNAATISFRPDFHAVCGAEILSGIDSEMHRTGAFGRPQPQSPVYSLDSNNIQQLIGIEGDMYLGQLTGYQDVKMLFPAHKNAGLPRNVGIFGTVGSGKTNTSQVLIEEASKNGWSVIVLSLLQEGFQ